MMQIGAVRAKLKKLYERGLSKLKVKADLGLTDCLLWADPDRARKWYLLRNCQELLGIGC